MIAPVESRALRLGVPAGWITGGALLVALVVAVARLGEGRRFAELLREAEPAWLGVAALLQVGTYLCAAGVWQRALRAGGVRLGVGGLVPLGLAKLFADQALPSVGLSGTLLVVRALVRRGVSHGASVAAMLARADELLRRVRARGGGLARGALAARRAASGAAAARLLVLASGRRRASRDPLAARARRDPPAPRAAPPAGRAAG